MNARMMNWLIATYLFIGIGQVFASSNFTLSSYNIRNFSQVSEEKNRDLSTDEKALIEVLKESQSDIMTFQEIINLSLFEQIFSKRFPRHRLLATECGGTADQKVAIAFNEDLFSLDHVEEEWRISLSTRCNFGLRPALITWLKHKPTKKKIAVVAVHLKAGSGDRNRATRKEQHQVLKTVLEELRAHQFDDIIVAGDFNTTSYFEQTPGAAQFEEFLEEGALNNTSKKVGCSSFWQGGQGEEKMLPSHLDHILHSGSARVKNAQSLAHCIRSRCNPKSPNDLGPSFNDVSDHCPIQTEFKFND